MLLSEYRKLGLISLRMSINSAILFYFIQALWIDFILNYNKNILYFNN